MERQCDTGEGLRMVLCCWRGDGWDQIRIKWCCSHIFAFQRISRSWVLFSIQQSSIEEEDRRQCILGMNCSAHGEVGPLIDSHLDPQCSSAGEDAGCIHAVRMLFWSEGPSPTGS
jgi:hypothetical protein